jgi:hypothetical protein
LIQGSPERECAICANFRIHYDKFCRLMATSKPAFGCGHNTPADLALPESTGIAGMSYVAYSGAPTAAQKRISALWKT